MSTSATRSRRAVRALAAVVLMAGTALGPAAPAFAAVPAGAAPALARTQYSAPAVQCTITDARLAATSGIAAAGGRLFAVNDTGPVALFALGSACQISQRIGLRIPAPADPLAQLRAPAPSASDPAVVITDVEDLAAAPDGSLWLADIGGNRADRRAVSLYRWPGSGTSVTRHDLRYPDGAHDAEALLISLTGQAIIVAKAARGPAGVYAAPLPLPRAGVLTKVAELNLVPYRRTGDSGPRSVQVTGGAVSPDGIHFALRTYTTAYEWDAADGDVVRALRSGHPRAVPLARDPQGEAIGYSPGGRSLLTAGERLPAAVREVAISRTRLTALGSAPKVGAGTLLGVLATIVLGGLVLLVGRERRRWTRRATTYQSG